MTLHLPTFNLEQRIRNMSLRWQYTADETAEALSGAAIDPKSWEAWVTWDERVTGTGSAPIPPGAFNRQR
jgi:hypothetical protein